VEAFAFGNEEKPLHDYTLPEYLAGEDGQPKTEFWFDFVGDVGDGWNSTYGVAYQLARPHLTFKTKDRPGTLASTRRGDLLIIGGDLVYPTPTIKAYDARFVKPYETAFPPRGQPAPKTLPHLFAIP